jgi:Domain of unknown function (DUF4295)
MAKKVSKNANVAKRTANMGSGKDHVKVIVPVKNPTTGAYSYKENMVHKEKLEDFLKGK